MDFNRHRHLELDGYYPMVWRYCLFQRIWQRVDLRCRICEWFAQYHDECSDNSFVKHPHLGRLGECGEHCHCDHCLYVLDLDDCDGITSVINLTGNYNSTRSLTYNLAANISLNQAITTFTGNGTGIFNFTGVVSGVSAGNGITKSGSSTLSLTNAANTYTGITKIEGGILDATTLANINTNSSIGKGSAAGSAADLVIDGGTLRHSAANVASTNRLFSIGTSGGTIDSSAASLTHTLSFTGTGAMGFNSQLGTRILTLGGSNVGTNTMAMAIGNDGSSNATSVSKTGSGLWILSGTNTYTGTTTATGGVLVATTAAALPGYDSLNHVVINGGAIGARLGGTGWTTDQVDILLRNATKTSGALAIDTTNGDLTQWSNLNATNLAGLGIAKAGSNNLTLDQAGNYGALSNYGNGNLVFDHPNIITSSLSNFGVGHLVLRNSLTATDVSVNGAGNVLLNDSTLNATSITFNTASSTSILSGTLSLSGATITNTDKSSNIVATITSSITGSPNVSVASRTAGNNYRGGMQFAPDGLSTQTLGTVSLDKTAATGDKGGINIGGVSTGNSIASVTNTSASFGALRKRGPGTWTLGSVSFGAFQNYAGTTIAQGVIDGTYEGTQVMGGALILDYTNADSDRLGDARKLSLLGGTLQLDRSSGATGTHTDIVASTTLSGGSVNITRGSGSTATLRLNVITRSAGATLNFGDANLASTDTLNTNGILGPWATVGGADWAYNSGSTTVAGVDASQPNGAADGYIRAYSGYTNVDRLTPGTISNGLTTNVRLVEGSGSAGNIALGAATTTINALNQSATGGTGAATIDTASKTLAVNGILAGAGSGGLTIGVAVNDGMLMTATASGELLVHNYSSNPLTINSVIANNTGASRLTVTGNGTTILAASNTYNGVTKIAGGVLEAAIGTGLSGSTYLQLDGGVFQSSGSFTRANNATASGTRFQWSGENGGGFAAKGGKLTVTVDNNASTTQVWAWVADAANTSLATGNSAILGPLKFGSSTADSEVDFRNNINLNGEVREINVTDNTGSSGDFATLSGVISNSSANSAPVAPAGIYKSGAGTLVLTNTNTYDGTTTISAGTLQVDGSTHASSNVFIGTAGTLTGTGTVNGNVSLTGNGVINKASGTIAGTLGITGGYWNGNGAVTGLITSSSGIFTIGNDANLTANGNLNVTGGSLTAGNPFSTLTGSLEYTSNSNTTFAGIIAGSGKTLTMNRANTRLTLSGANTYTGATNITSGTLEISGSGSINSTSAINVAGGASFIYNSSTALTVAPTLNGTEGNRASFSGSGTISAPMTLNSLDSVLAPGNSPGIQVFGVSQEWESFTYEWELNDWANQVPGTGGNIDQIQITGGLTLSGTSYALNIFSLDALNAAGLVGANGGNLFTETSKSWTILTTTTGISGFNASTWTLDTTGFLDEEAGSWSLASTGNDLVLSYTVIPEPKAALLGGLGILLLFRRRR